MFDVGGGELILIVLATLVLFGPKKIPEVASMIGKGMRKVRDAQDEFTRHMRDLSTELEQTASVSPVLQSVSHNATSAVAELPEAEVVTADVERHPQSQSVLEQSNDSTAGDSQVAEENVEPSPRLQTATGTVARAPKYPAPTPSESDSRSDSSSESASASHSAASPET